MIKRLYATPTIRVSQVLVSTLPASRRFPNLETGCTILRV
jgi:hypothetical protein